MPLSRHETTYSVTLNLDRVRENLSEGVGWRKHISVKEDQAIAHLQEIGFTPNGDGTYTVRESDLVALRPGELMTAEPAEPAES